MEHNRESEVTWQELLTALVHNISLFANDVPHQDMVKLKRELRHQCKLARKILAIEKVKL